jgi:hypothetical protein
MDLTNLKYQYDVIIYCGGKCGSLTLTKTFENANYNVLHTHSDIEFVYSNKEISDYYDCYTVKDLITKQISDKVYIIDSYRTPIEREMSSFFENIITRFNIDYYKININILIYYFNKYLLGTIDSYHPLDIETPIFNDIKFNFENEYITKKIDNKIYIKLRLKSSDKWTKILSEIFQKNIIITNINIAANKNYNNIYKEFISKYRLPNHYLKNIINDPVFLKYNLELEQLEYFKYWCNLSESNEYFLNKINYCDFINIPEDFDYIKYSDTNPNFFNNLSKKEIYIHYEVKGYYENIILPSNKSNELNEIILNESNKSNEPNDLVSNESNDLVLNELDKIVLNESNDLVLNESNDLVLNELDKIVLNKSNDLVLNEPNDQVSNESNDLVLNELDKIVLNELDKIVLNELDKIVLNESNDLVLNKLIE